ncbi:AAA family ATPase [Saccharopolyspora erythraea]|uniref:ATP-binding protein n=1 Tax=Saccharopolyspora erythraea TaxID=1836 RepID=UPI001BA59028|nr:LuxR family transcriptional regulator [Saccharopolyspora erythraea]QUH01938.1 AAA family ATPase [Saccharopolyspora erythraea]
MRVRAAGHVSSLVGRDRELSMLEECARMAALGTGQTVLLRGPAGIGRTKLLGAALDDLDPVTPTVLSVSCPESGASAYAAVRALFEPLGLTGDSPRLAGRAALARPALLPARPRAEAVDAYSVMYGLHWLVSELCEKGPVVLAVDDVHWCDEASLSWLGFLLRRSEELPLLVLLTQRTGRDVPNPQVLAEIGASSWCLAVDLQPLTAEAVRAVLRRAFGAEPEDAFVRKCFEVTGGTPFLLGSIVARLREGPVEQDAVNAAALDELGRQIVAGALVDRMSPDALAVARAVAVLGGEDIELVAALAGTQPGPAAAAVRALRDDELLLPDRLHYAHDLVRQTVLESVPVAELTALRERAAMLLNDSGRSTEEVAGQLLRLPGPPQPWVANVLRDAAVEAESRGAPAAAARYLTRALEADDSHVPVLVHLAKVLAHVDPRAALRHLDRALDLVTDPRRRVPLAVQYALTSLGARNSLRAFELVGSVLDALDAEIGRAPSPADRSLRTLAESALLLSGLHEKSTVRQVGERFRGVPLPAGDTAEERQLLALLASLAALQGQPAAEVAARAHQVRAISDVTLGGRAVLSAVLPLYLADHVDASLEVLNRWLEDAQLRGTAWMFSLCASTRALVQLWAGNAEEALSDAQASHDMVMPESWADVALPQAVLALALVRRGEPARALHVLETVTRPRLERFTFEYHWLLIARGRALAAVGDHVGALQHLHRCRDSLAESGIGNPLLAPWWYDAVDVLIELGRGEEAFADLELAEEQAVRWGTRRALGMVRAARGRLTPGPAGIDLLAGAVDLLAGSPAKLEYAKAEYLLGQRLFRRGDAEGARDRLRRSIDVAVLCRDELQLRLSLPALAEAGGRMRRGTASPADVLSEGERRVAAKAVTGATNREIAEALFLTVRTVELHLTSVYRKLGLKGRAELADALGAHS